MPKMFLAGYAGKVLHFLRKSCGKRSFWKASFSVFAKVSWKMLVLEGFILTFCGNIVENAHFGSVDSKFLRKSRGKRSFWKCGFSLFAKILWKRLLLEVWIHSHFLQRSHGKRLFWKCGYSLFASARFGSVDCHFLRQSRGKCVERKGGGEGKGKAKGRAKSCVFFVVCCSRGVCATTCLLEGERARVYVPIC